MPNCASSEMNGMTESRIYLDANVFIYAIEGSDDIAGRLRRLFDLFRRIFDLQPVNRDILIETAEYRRTVGNPKLPDAIHAVTAIRGGCQTVLSSDSRLRLPAGYTVLTPERENLSRLIQDLS